MKFIKMIMSKFISSHPHSIQGMKQVEDIKKIVKEMVDLTHSDDLNSNPLAGNIIKMPELALVMAKYFTSLGKYCLSFYNGYQVKEKIQKKSKKGRESRGEMPPRKPVTAYIAYYQEKVPAFQEKYLNYTISELTRLIAKQWSDLPEQQKNPYIQKAANDRKRYERQHKEYKQGGKKEEPQVSQPKLQQVHSDESQSSHQNDQQQDPQPQQNEDEI